jgi:calcineurin-like phosphoesterase family protein
MREIAAFFSDPHFGHTAILESCKRPFQSIVHMNEDLIARYNERVRKTDTVLWLGDCFFRMPVDEARGMLDRMHGTKILIPGNHDKSVSAMSKIGFALVIPSATLVIDGVTCRCSHYPFASSKEKDPFAAHRPPKIRGEILLHGHSHRHSPITPGRLDEIDVGVDAWGYNPPTLDDVQGIIRSLKET